MKIQIASLRNVLSYEIKNFISANEKYLQDNFKLNKFKSTLAEIFWNSYISVIVIQNKSFIKVLIFLIFSIIAKYIEIFYSQNRLWATHILPTNK